MDGSIPFSGKSSPDKDVPKNQIQGLCPLPSLYSFCSHKMSKQKNAPQCLFNYVG